MQQVRNEPIIVAQKSAPLPVFPPLANGTAISPSRTWISLLPAFVYPSLIPFLYECPEIYAKHSSDHVSTFLKTALGFAADVTVFSMM